MYLSSTAESFFQLIVLLIIFVFVLGLTYFATRWIAGYKKSVYSTKNMEILETFKITEGKYLQIVRAGKNKCFLIGLGKNEITSLGELSMEELYATDSQEVATVPSFNQVFSKIKEKVVADTMPAASFDDVQDLEKRVLDLNLTSYSNQDTKA